MDSTDQKPWWRRALAPLSLLYGWVMKLRRHSYKKGWLKQNRLGVPVLSVGNIRVGGTGKTPVVSALVAAALESGRKPAVLARGYRSGLSNSQAGVFLAGRFYALTPIADDLIVVADEARLHSARHPSVPVIIGADRQRAYRLFWQRYCQQSEALSANSPQGQEGQCEVDMVILEDGGQHLAIHRDFDLMLIDWHTTLSSIQPLPSGDYREGLDVLQGASAVMVTRCPPPNSTEWQQPPGQPLWQSLPTAPYFAQFRLGSIYRLGPSHSECQTQNGILRLHLLTGIAQPERLYHQLKATPMTLKGQVGEARLVNHSFYGDHELLPIDSLAPAAAGATATDCASDGLTGNVGWLITEKDLYRQEAQFRACRHPVWVVPLELNLSRTAEAEAEASAEGQDQQPGNETATTEPLWRALIESACQ